MPEKQQSRDDKHAGHPVALYDAENREGRPGQQGPPARPHGDHGEQHANANEPAYPPSACQPPVPRVAVPAGRSDMRAEHHQVPPIRLQPHVRLPRLITALPRVWLKVQISLVIGLPANATRRDEQGRHGTF
jgi:hypothetical protein